MKINTIAYSFKQAVNNMVKNRLLTLASVSTMAACLFIFGLFYIILGNIQFITSQIEEEISITTFFDEDITEDEIDDLKAKIESQEIVKSIEYVSAEEAWKRFVESMDGGEELLLGFEGDNPLEDSASFEIHLTSVSEQEAFVEYLETLPGIRQVNNKQQTADTIGSFNKFILYVSIVIIGILLFIAVFLINNTIRIGISVRKQEIGIMKLIGATDLFIKSPFILEGAFIGLIGAGIPSLILYIMYERVIRFFDNNLTFLQDMMNFVHQDQIFSVLTPVILLIGVSVGILGSLWTLRKHLNV